MGRDLDGRWAMGDHDDYRAACPQSLHGRTEGFIALRVEVGIGFIENHQERVAEESSSQPHPLLLSSGQLGAASADQGVVAVRKTCNQLVGVGCSRGCNDRVGRIGLGEAGDVLRNCSVEQLRVLGKIPDQVRELAYVVVLERDTIPTMSRSRLSSRVLSAIACLMSSIAAWRLIVWCS